MPKIERNIPLGPLTTFKIGGRANYYVEVKSTNDMLEVCRWVNENNVPVIIIGGGSNVLFSDDGFRGLVIRNNIKGYKVTGDKIVAGSGMLLSSLLAQALRESFSGLEWAIGIPGTVGGAVAGNAGAYGEDMSGTVESVSVLDCDDVKVINLDARDCDFSYRDSVFKRGDNLFILDATLRFKKEKTSVMQEAIKKNLKQRNTATEMSHKSAGCFFKNIEWKNSGVNKKEMLANFPELKKFSDKPKIAVGFLIEEAGLKGERIGDASVSEKHAGFILNLGKATSDEIMMLVGLIKNKIYDKYGLVLEEEVKLIGFE